MAKTYVCALLLTVAVLAAIMYTTDAVTCYSDANGGNAVPNCVFCQKFVTTAIGVTVSQVRSCASTCIASSSGAVGSGTANYCCQTDNCNSATSTQVNLVAALLTSICALWYLH